MENRCPLESVERLMFSDMFTDKKVLVTGNTGFKGSWLTVWLLKLGARVYGISKDIPSQPSMFEELGLRQKITHYQQDIRDVDKLCALVAEIKPDFVFHLAAQPIVSLSYQDPIETLSSNVMGTANVLEALRRSAHPCCAVIVTSDKCYDNVEWVWGYRESDRLGGKDIYSGSKGAAELVFKSYFHSFFAHSEIKVASARAGNVIGGGDWAADRIVPDCMRAWSIGRPVTIRNPHATRPWQHVLEPLSGYLALAQALVQNPGNVNGESFNFGPSAEQNYSVARIIEDLSPFWGFKAPSDSYQVSGGAAFAESKLLKLNCDKALHSITWLPSLEYGRMIEYVASWYYTYYKKPEPIYEFTLDQISRYETEAARKGLQWLT
jgi:CDP-glucose 4,6-dehydratase